MFSTLVIRNCALNTSKPITLSLKASPSFPSCAVEFNKHPHPAPDSWAAKDVSTAQGTLELSLSARISEGRIGVSYSAQVVSGNNDGSDITSTLPQYVCIKFAKPQHCRSLAREAWFYEQLVECQGTSTAKCYGFFSSTFSEQDDTPNLLLPWRDLKHPCDPEDEEDLKLPWTPVISSDWLPDDPPFSKEYCDTRNFKRDSAWNTWKFFTGESSTISVLVLELLGEPCSDYWKDAWDKPSEGLKEDLISIMKDVGTYGLVHGDVTAFNFLRFTGEAPEARCPRHNVVHGWRIIDFDRSLKVDMENGGAKATRSPDLYNTRFIGSLATFWGNLL